MNQMNTKTTNQTRNFVTRRPKEETTNKTEKTTGLSIPILHLGLETTPETVIPVVMVMTVIPKKGEPHSINEFPSGMDEQGNITYKIGVLVHTYHTREVLSKGGYGKEPIPLLGFTNDGQSIDLEGDIFATLAVNKEQYKDLVALAATHNSPMIGILRSSQKVNTYIDPTSGKVFLYMAIHSERGMSIHHVVG